MPFIRITTNEKIEKCQEDLIRMDLGCAIECISGKTEAWLMIEVRDEARMAFSGETWSCAMVEVDLFGAADPVEKNALTEQICNTVNVATGVPTDRIYVRYLETDAWGFDCKNF